MPIRYWTPEEDDIVRAEYPKGERRALAIRLNRSIQAVNNRASNLKVKIEPDATFRNRSRAVGCGKANRGFKGYGRICAFYVSNLRQRGWPVTITAQYLDSISVDICPLSGRKLTYRRFMRDGKSTASLDRIDSSKGYVEGNVRWIHKEVNIARWEMTDEEFLSWVHSIVEHYDGVFL